MKVSIPLLRVSHKQPRSSTQQCDSNSEVADIICGGRAYRPRLPEYLGDILTHMISTMKGGEKVGTIVIGIVVCLFLFKSGEMGCLKLAFIFGLMALVLVGGAFVFLLGLAG